MHDHSEKSLDARYRRHFGYVSGYLPVFEPGAIDRFTVPNRSGGDNPDSGPPIRVNQQIALAR